MIPVGVQIFVALEPVDMRMGFERLSGIVRERMGLEPLGGALFVFLGRRRQCIKVVFWDGSGLCLFHKRLDKGLFPRAIAPKSLTRAHRERGAETLGPSPREVGGS